MIRPGAGVRHAVGAVAGLALTLILFWPGIALYDSVDQYAQVLSGAYEDWHPPVMARLWSLFHRWWPRTAPMLAAQLGLYWLGIGLIAAACARRGRAAGGWAVCAIGAVLFLSGWMGAIVKDAQMVAALIAAVGIVAWFRIREARLPVWAAAIAGLLLAYAVLLRANAVFAVAPLAFALFEWGASLGWKKRALSTFASFVLVILVSPVVNHGLLGARPTGIEKSLLIYDISGAAAHLGTEALVSAPGRKAPGSCYSPLEWDGLVAIGCPGEVLLQQPTSAVARLWVAMIARHPLAYGAHRLAHFNMTMRLFVPAGVPHAVSPIEPEPNVLGLGVAPRPALRGFHRFGIWASSLPLSWPAVWLALDLIAFWAAVRAEREPFRDLAFALSLSALSMGASFLAISIASDLRYHLWTMLASMLALALLAAAGALTRRHWTAAAIVLVAITIVGGAGRLLLPGLA